MSTEPTEPSTPPGPMTTTSREVRPTTKKATKSKTKRKTKKSMSTTIYPVRITGGGVHVPLRTPFLGRYVRIIRNIS
jgi:hypothetical protein